MMSRHSRPVLKGSCDSLGARPRSLVKRAADERFAAAAAEPDGCGRSEDDDWPRWDPRSVRPSDPDALPRVVSDVSFFNGPDDGPGAFQYTLALIKPEAARLMYKIESVMGRNGFIVNTKAVLRLTREQAAEFYDEHAVEMYFPRLVDHMSGGPIVAYVLAKRNCVDEWRRLIGPANVGHAKRYFPVSLRAIYGTEPTAVPVANAFHGSDSPAAAEREIRFFFPNVQIEPMTNHGDRDDTLRYIHNVMMPTITEGLSSLFKINPADPLRWFGHWLLTKSVKDN